MGRSKAPKGERLQTTGGSSGAPVIFDGSVNLESFNNAIGGVHVSGKRVRPGESAFNKNTRLDADWIDFINDFISDHAADTRTDRPALVDYDNWLQHNSDASGLSVSNADVGRQVTVNAKVFNGGTAAANNVTVRFKLSLNGPDYGPLDRLLGTATIPSISPFESAVATLTFTVPNVGSGLAHVVWAIDPDNTVNEFDTPWNDLVVRKNGSGASPS